MRLRILFGITCLSLLFSACGQGGGTSGSAADPTNSAAGTAPNTSPKSIFSVWTEENNTFSLDFRSAQFGVSSDVFITSKTVGSCQCQVVIQGSQTGGTMTFSNCSNGSIGCISLSPSGTYTKSGSTVLQLCTSNSCNNMR